MASVNNDPAPRQPKILLVDDREDNLLSIEAILAPDGYQFFRAYSGHEALKILLNEIDFAMILMDVKMPVLNGFETASLIYEREKLRHIPIIFITANNYGDENLFKGYKSGGIDYIFKPINPEVLRAKVAVFIDIYQKNAELLEQELKLSAANRVLEDEVNKLKTAQKRSEEIQSKLRDEISELENLLVSSPYLHHIEFESCDLNLLIRNCLDELDDHVKTATILLEPLPKLKVSRILMRTLFRNLIGRALTHRENNIKPTIKISAEIGADNKYQSIIVENNSFGMNGIDPINDDLVICKTIMEKHKGFVSANGKKTEGASLILSFPIA